MPPDYSSMSVKELEERIGRILGRQRNQDDLFRLAVFTGQLDLARFVYHDRKYQPDSRHANEMTKSSETMAYGHALVQLLLLAKSRKINFPEVFKYALEHMEGHEEYKVRTPKALQNKKEIKGLPIGKGVVKGGAYVVSEKNPISGAPKGSVLILPHADSRISHMIRDFTAVVADQGGRLCHLAIVARETGTPAIVGTGNATKLIKTGNRVSVDTGSGKVTIG